MAVKRLLGHSLRHRVVEGKADGRAESRVHRVIQWRGRTSRSEAGRVEVLITEDSRDEAFLYAEMGREKKMKGIVKRMARRKEI